MNRLRVTIRVLSVVLLAMLVRLLIDGLTTLTVVTAAIIITLLLAAIGLYRHGRHLDPAPATSGDTSSKRHPTERAP